ncbi:MAG TPA: hypothetical protein VEH62_03125 [Gemmatimonadales bacterium]|nr:hypothetical protein [Gemmatimonadales bacterium]
MLGIVLAFLAGIQTPQDTATVDAPVYDIGAYGVSLPRPFDDWVFEPGVGPEATTVIFHPRGESLREQLWGALLLTSFRGEVPLRRIVEQRLETTWRPRLGRSFVLGEDDTLTIAGLPAMHTVVSGAIDHVALDVEEYTIARGGDLIVLQLRYPRGLPRDSIAAGYERVVAGLRIRGGGVSRPAATSLPVENVATARDMPDTPWQVTAYDALVRYDAPDARADFVVRMNLSNDGLLPEDSVAVWVWPALTMDSVRGDSLLAGVRASAGVWWVRLPAAAAPQDSTTLTIYYHGSGADPAVPSRLMRLAATGAFAAIDWLPRVQPALDSALQLVRASRPRLTLSFDVPDEWRAVAPGRLTSDGASLGRRHMTWRSDQVTATVPAFALGPYRVVTRPEAGVAVSVWLTPADSPSTATIDSLAASVRTAWVFCSRAFGRLPTSEVDVAATDVPRAQGFAGLLLLGHPASFGGVRDDTVVADAGLPSLGDLAHELARTWWGNSAAAAGPGSAWIVEAIPAWTALAIRGVEEGDSVRQRLVRDADSVWHSVARGRDLPLSRLPAWGPDVELLGAKGVAALEAARRAQGEALFRETLLTLAVEHRNSWITLDDVLTALGPGPAALLRSYFF